MKVTTVYNIVILSTLTTTISSNVFFVGDDYEKNDFSVVILKDNGDDCGSWHVDDYGVDYLCPCPEYDSSSEQSSSASTSKSSSKSKSKSSYTSKSKSNPCSSKSKSRHVRRYLRKDKYSKYVTKESLDINPNHQIEG